MICAITPPIDAPTTCARSMPSASSTSIASCAIRTRSYGPGGASECPVPRLSIAMQRWLRPNAPRWSAQPRAFMPRPWIISTGEPSRLPQTSYAMRTPSLATISLTRPRICSLEQTRNRVAHRLAEARGGERIVGVVRDRAASPADRSARATDRSQCRAGRPASPRPARSARSSSPGAAGGAGFPRRGAARWARAGPRRGCRRAGTRACRARSR